MALIYYSDQYSDRDTVIEIPQVQRRGCTLARSSFVND